MIDHFHLRIYLGRCPVSLLLVQRISLGGKWCANMIKRGCRPGCGSVWRGFCSTRLTLAQRNATQWKVRGRSVPPSCLAGEEREEAQEAERDAVLGITSHGGLQLLKIRDWYFPLFEMSSFWVSFYHSIFRRTVLWNMQQSPTELHTLICWNVFGLICKNK